ncbi:ABC transporter permease [Rossellomorea vietnamensis]|uniref:ABC transporter permease n=1 Tax=Rossellomorea vietnamensis TaxID=218284 RepID=A0A5D4KEZ5_9BACI|nr:ABC transporter permease [Rossellomorea vietnamensis]TYR74803.1 ABC transporter permease [Rossellomorea vietnamensis]
MSMNDLIFRNLKKNLKNYYLYVFALIFSVALYFAFVTLQFDPSMDETKGTIKGAAAVRTASILLVAIVSIFLLYANNIFIKRRSKEIGLFQLIGMTKGRIFRLLSAENFILYFGSIIAGVFIGFSFSKLIIMILFKVTGVDAIATLHFSERALIQTLIVFAGIYLLIMLMNYIFIKRQSILSLFRVTSSTEERVKKISVWEVLMGVLGLLLILSGYYTSSKLFGGDFTTINELFFAMAFILASVIIGTYFFYKGSVRFIANLIRNRKNGYLNIYEVLSLSSIMFRMKSNALLLTIITTVSALAISLLSLSYISYYSAEKSAKNSVPEDFTFAMAEDAQQFKDILKENGIPFNEETIEVLQAKLDLSDIMESKMAEMNMNPEEMLFPVISEKSVDGVELKENEILFTGYNDTIQTFLSLKDSGSVTIQGNTIEIPQTYLGIQKEYYISWYFSSGGIPVAVVNESTFNKLKNDLDPEIQMPSSLYIGVEISKKSQVEKANELFTESGLAEKDGTDSQLAMSTSQKQTMGVVMFIVGFLGLTFLITSGCILYFKQMDESESERQHYTILRKLGYTQGDLLKGIQLKQVYNFGIPLVTGLLHSYFAIKSGWFLFGTELWTPMLLVMGLYTALYSIFGILSVLYYKKVIKESL